MFAMDAKSLKKFFLYSFVAFMVAFMIVSVNIAYPKLMQSFDGKIRDYMFLIRGTIPPKDDVVIVDMI
jgi:CHASE2 domain-containing sensor protein